MLKYLWLVLLMPHSILPATTTDRPYKFGFDIKGYQHRMEEKDEKGIIKGEYGFITADGYYRVTVYATDEDGKFHIISMKNYYVGFPPEDPVTTTVPPSHSQGNQRQPQTFGSRAPNAGGPNRVAEDRATESPKAFTRPQGIAACSDCFIPTQPPPNQQQPGFNSGVTRGGNAGSLFGGGRGGANQPPQSSLGGNVQQLSQRGRDPERGIAGGFAGGPARDPAGGIAGGFGGGPARGPVQGITGGSPGGPARGPARGPAPHLRPGSSPFSGNVGSSFPEGNPLGPDVKVNLNSVNGGFGPSGGRTDFTQNNQLGDPPHRRPQIGEVRDGLPPGVSLSDISDLLYTFNYTVGNAGHHEDGYRNGDKTGDYHVISREGVKQDVEYLANEFGYQPNITFTPIHNGKPYVPADDNELKGYEFKWFYRK